MSQTPIPQRDSIVAFHPGSFIVKQGERVGSAFFVKSGSVELFYVTEDGTQLLSETLGPESILCVAACYYGVPYPLSMKTVGIVEVRRLPRTVLEKMLADSGDPMDRVMQRMRGELTRRLLQESWIAQRVVLKLDECHAAGLRMKNDLETRVRSLSAERTRLTAEVVRLKNMVEGVPSAPIKGETSGVVTADLNRAFSEISTEPKTPEMSDVTRDRNETLMGGYVTPTHGHPTAK